MENYPVHGAESLASFDSCSCKDDTDPACLADPELLATDASAN